MPAGFVSALWRLPPHNFIKNIGVDDDGPPKDPRHVCTIDRKGLQVSSKSANVIRKKRK
jgi:hypothetical protein